MRPRGVAHLGVDVLPLGCRKITVTIFEKDHLADNAEPRTGVPQGRHVHSIWKRGLTLMEASFPGLTAELVEGG